ncbi:MAG: DUF2339 domain-containing protein [Bacteroidales bacterium]|nr:DUF2339 domain-containing protein [Bacteroidales bacterium]
MEFLLFIIVLAILIILIVNNSNINSRLKEILKEVEYLKFQISRIETPEKSPKPTVKSAEEAISPKNADEKTKQEPLITPLPEIEKPVVPVENPISSAYEDTIKAKLEAMKHSQTVYSTAATTQTQKTASPPKPVKQPTDFEKFIGENLISKIGIIILVLGIGFFVKYAIDNNWIGVYGRTAIGLATGGLLIAVAHYLRKSYKTFSSLLTGGGLAVFYLTIAIAFHQYHIFSQTAAFVIMIVITIFSVMLSLLYDKKELAIFSQVGGYAAPFMLSTGDGNYIILFSYLLILNAGLLILAYFKRWHILNLLAFLFTIIIFSGWLATTFWGKSIMPYRNALLFATAFYIVFFLVNILNNLKERKPFKTAEIMMILSNNLFFFISGMTILRNYEAGIYKGLFTVLLGIFNFGWLLYLYQKKQVDRNLIYLLVALVMTYISLAIPIQLNGHSITLFWAAELVILLWLSRVSGIKILRAGHLIILVLVLGSLIMDWGNLYKYHAQSLPVIFNQVFITGLVVLAALVGSFLILRRETELNFVNNIISTNSYKGLLTFILFIVAFLVPFLELIYQVKNLLSCQFLYCSYW